MKKRNDARVCKYLLIMKSIQERNIVILTYLWFCETEHVVFAEKFRDSNQI